MRSILVQVNPKQVKFDELPIDPSNAAEIQRQAVAWGGIHTPIEIWIPDPDLRQACFDDPSLLPEVGTVLVMDGFHRTNIAIALGYQTISALLYDCAEDEFWDKRISQARKHHVVENDRLHRWMLSSWRQTEFPHDAGQNFDETIKRIFDTLSGVKHAHAPKSGKAIVDWFNRKAELWGRPAIEICKVILEKERVIDPRKPEVVIIAGEIGLNASQTRQLTEVAVKSGSRRFGSGVPKQQLKRYAQEVITQNLDTPFDDWRERERQREEANRQREKQFAETEAGIVAKKRRRLDNATEAVNALGMVEHRIGEILQYDLAELMVDRPYITTRLQRFLDKANQLAAKANLAAVANIQGADTLALHQRVVELEKQLQQQARPIIVPESVMAHSSAMYN